MVQTLKTMLKAEYVLPKCIILHLGNDYLGNKEFNVNQIEVDIETTFILAQSKIKNQQMSRSHQQSVKLIWSRIIAHPGIGRGVFSFRAAYEGLKKVNSDVAVTLNAMGVGIIKHGEIDPKSALFYDREGKITELAKRQFVRNLNDYLWELQTSPPSPEKLATEIRGKNKKPAAESHKKSSWEEVQLLTKQLEANVEKTNLLQRKMEDLNKVSNHKERQETQHRGERKKAFQDHHRRYNPQRRDRPQDTSRAYHKAGNTHRHAEQAQDRQRSPRSEFEQFLEFQQFQKMSEELNKQGYSSQTNTRFWNY